MQTHPDVAVIAVPSEPWGETPLALVVWANERVGRQQRIGGVVLRDSLPRSPNGKILKREPRAQYVRV